MSRTGWGKPTGERGDETHFWNAQGRRLCGKDPTTGWGGPLTNVIPEVPCPMCLQALADAVVSHWRVTGELPRFSDSVGPS